MNTMLIGIGQAGTTIAIKTSEILFKYNPELIEDIYPNTFINLNDISCKCFLIDSESKVIESMISPNIQVDKKDNISKYFSKYTNISTNVSGRGSNWALGYSTTFKEYKQENNINISSFEKIEKFIEKCDFINKIIVIHSLNGGTGSGVGTRIIEMLKDNYNKMEIVSCPVFGFNLERTTLSQFNMFFTIGKTFDLVNQIIRLDNESNFDGKKFSFNDELYSKVISDYIIYSKKDMLSINKYYQNNKFIEINGIYNEYLTNINDVSITNLSKKFFQNKGNEIYTCDAIFKTNNRNFKGYHNIFKGLCKNVKIDLDSYNNSLINPFNDFYVMDKNIKNNKIDISVLYKSNNLLWMDDMLDKVSTYVKYG